MAGEIGHITVEPGGRTCRCGNAGCLETYASATGIVERYRELAGIEEVVTAEEIHHRALEGDPNARQSYREAGRSLGLAFAVLVNLLNPERIIVGGGVLPAWDLFMPAAEQVAPAGFRRVGDPCSPRAGGARGPRRRHRGGRSALAPQLCRPSRPAVEVYGKIVMAWAAW